MSTLSCAISSCTAVFASALKTGIPLLLGLLGRPVELPWPIEAFLQAIVLLQAFGLPYAVAVLAAVAFTGAIGWGTQRIAVRPLVERGAPILGPILALLGMLAIFRESISLIFGPDPHNLPAPFGLRQVSIGPFAGTPRDFFIIGGRPAG